MNHKDDAINKAMELIEIHKNYGLGDEQARQTSIIAANNAVRITIKINKTQSLYQRTINYLNSINFK